MNKRGLFIVFAFILIFFVYGCGCNKTAGTGTVELGTGEIVPISFVAAPELPAVPGVFTQEVQPTNTDHADVVLIPGGTYLLGSPTTDETAILDEQPAHLVDLYPFWIYTHEVTNAQYAACVAAGVCFEPQQTEGRVTDYYDVASYADNPVVGVDWLMADDYCQWAGGRLPTEAEWEAAARGTDARLYPWGLNDPTCSLANMKGCSVEQTTQPANGYPDGASPFEALDMAGNTWEWVNDWYQQDYYDSITRLYPQGPNIADAKVVKGGGFKSAAFNLRTPGRLAVVPYDNYEDLGFRCVAGGPTGVSSVEHPADTHHSSDGGGSVEEGGSARRRISEISFVTSYCNTDGTGTFVFTARNNFEGSYLMDYDGTAFSCSYDGIFHLLICSGMPPATPHNGSYFEGAVYVTHPTDGIQTWATFTFGEAPAARRCQGRLRSETTTPLLVNVAVTCPTSGLVGVTINSNPALTWGLAELNGIGMTCLPNPTGGLICTGNDSPVGGLYNFHFTATSTDGTRTYDWTQSEPVQTGCSATGEEATPNIKVYANCNRANPGTYDFIANWTPSGFVFSSVFDAMDGMLSCRSLSGDAMYCSGAHLGSDGALHLNFVHPTTGGSVSYNVVAPPYRLCEAPETPETPGGWSFEGLECTGNPGWYLMSMRYPAGPALTGISLNGVVRVLTLDPSDPGRILLIVGETDFPANITITRSDGTSSSQTFTASSPFASCTDENGRVPAFTTKAFCDNTNGQYIVQIAWNPPDFTIDYVRELGDGYPSCTPAFGGQIVCYGLTPAADGLITLGLFHVDPATGDTSSYRVTAAPTLCSADGTEGDGAGIQDPRCTSDGGIEFYVLTYAGRGYAGVAAADNLNVYTCTLTTIGEGGVYRCTGPAISGSPGPLVVALQHGDGTSYNNTFPEWDRTHPTCGGEQPQSEEWTLSTSCSNDYPGWAAMDISWPESLNPVGTTWMNWSTGCYRNATMTHSMVCMARLPASGTLTAYVNSVGSGEQTHSWENMETRLPTTCGGGDNPNQPGGFRLSVQCSEDPNTMYIQMGFPSDWADYIPTIMDDGMRRAFTCTPAGTSLWNCTMSGSATPGPLIVVLFTADGSREREHSFFEYPSLLASACGAPGSVSPKFSVTPSCGSAPGYYNFSATWTPPDFTVYRVDDLTAGAILGCDAPTGNTINCYDCLMSGLDGLLHVQFVNRPDSMSVTENLYPYNITPLTGCFGEEPTLGWGISIDCNSIGPTDVAHFTITYPSGMNITNHYIEVPLLYWSCTWGSAPNSFDCIVRPRGEIPDPFTWNFYTTDGAVVSHTFSGFSGAVPTCNAPTETPGEPTFRMNATCRRTGVYIVDIYGTVPINRVTDGDYNPLPAGSCSGLGTTNVACVVPGPSGDGNVRATVFYNQGCVGGTCYERGVTIMATPGTCPSDGQPGSGWSMTANCEELYGITNLLVYYPAEYMGNLRMVESIQHDTHTCRPTGTVDSQRVIFMHCDPGASNVSFVIRLSLRDGTHVEHAFDPASLLAGCGGTTGPGGGTQPGGGGTTPGGGGVIPCSSWPDNPSCSAAGCCWWKTHGSGCHDYCEPSCEDMSTKDDCNAWGGCYWWGDACHSYAEPPFDCYAAYGTDKTSCLADARCDWDGAQCFNRP